MVDQQIVHEEIVDGYALSNNFEEKSVYSILAAYVNDAEKSGSYVKGYIDGEETYQAFLNEFNALCKTKFIIRTSWRKLASTLPRRSRYGKEERIFWEYNNGNLTVPFSGVPFVVRSCVTKQCHYGSHYYKSTAEKLTKQLNDHQNDPSVPLPVEKKRRNKPSKKRNCPAILHVREVVMFPDFGMDVDKMHDFKHHSRQEKSRLLYQLKDAIVQQKTDGRPLNCIQRFYLNLPLPEVHIGHPEPCGGIAPTLHQAVTEKIDSLVTSGIYDARHVRIIVHDYVREVVLKQIENQYLPYNVMLFPTENVIADYIYMSSITTRPSVDVDDDDIAGKQTVKAELEGSFNELMDLFQNCSSAQTLTEAKNEVKKLIDTVNGQLPSNSSPKRKCRKISDKNIQPLQSGSFVSNDCAPKADDSLTRIEIVGDEALNETINLRNSDNHLTLNTSDSLLEKSLPDESLLNFIPVQTTLDLPLESNSASLPLLSITDPSTYNVL